MLQDGTYLYGYDAWNRLVHVKRKGGSQAVVATYRYDGLGHRVYKKVENSGDMNREEYYYYNQGWQLLEIDNADNVARQQFVWGTNYIDEAICMDVDTDDDGDCTDFEGNPIGARRFFYMQDANWNVTALREGTSIVERYEYDPYGTVRICRGSASPGAPEQRTVTAQSLKWLNPSLPGNPVLYAGYFHDNETVWHNVRNRTLTRDRWMQRDPLEYEDASNLYEYAASDPISETDPTGMAGSTSTPTTVPTTQTQPCTCCCCVDSLQITNVRKIITSKKIGHGFDTVIQLSYIRNKVEEDCTLEWLEKNTLPSYPEIPIDQWFDMYQFPKTRPDFAGSWDARKKPCGKSETVTDYDEPALRRWRHRTAQRRIDFMIIVHSAPDCPCTNRSLMVTAEQRLVLADNRPQLVEFTTPW
jgi:RHS repeat-associated protein